MGVSGNDSGLLRRLWGRMMRRRASHRSVGAEYLAHAAKTASGTDFKLAVRPPAETVTWWNTWGES